MRKKSKNNDTEKKTVSDNTIIRLKRDTVQRLKVIQYKKFRETGIDHSYDKIINSLLTAN